MITLQFHYRLKPLRGYIEGLIIILAVYSHYNRGHFYNAHPKVFVTYRGGNNHKHDRFYADRHMTKPAVHHPAPAVHHKAPAPAPHNGKHDMAHNDRRGSERHMAMNTSRGNGGHFSGRR